MTERHTAAFTIPAEHPSLPGHFPGTPVVAGVIVLDQVLLAMEQWQQGSVSVRGLKQVKFHAPLLPEQRADISLEREGTALRFRVMRTETLIAQGSFEIA